MRFKVRVEGFETLHELPGAWSAADFRAMLEVAEIDGVEAASESDLEELCLMALADREPEQAAEIVLRYRLAALLREGQIQDVAHDMVDEPLWEDYPDMKVHEALYSVNQLLYDAFSGRFPRPRAVSFRLFIEAHDDDAREALSRPSEALLLKVIASGLDEDAVLNRLFEDSLAAGPFPEAEHVLWQYDVEEQGNGIAVRVIGSAYWFEPVRDLDSFQAVVSRG